MIIHAGIAFNYLLLQISLWWLFHTSTLFWKILFPFHARSFVSSYGTKHIFVACIIAGIGIPLVPIIASMADFAMRVNSDPVLLRRGVTFASGGLGYGLIRFPPIICSGTNSNVAYYSLVLPINIITAIVLTELILIFWTIHKVRPHSWGSLVNWLGISSLWQHVCIFVLFVQQHGIFTVKKSSSSPFKIGAPERKVLLLSGNPLCSHNVHTVHQSIRTFHTTNICVLCLWGARCQSWWADSMWWALQLPPIFIPGNNKCGICFPESIPIHDPGVCLECPEDEGEVWNVLAMQQVLWKDSLSHTSIECQMILTENFVWMNYCGLFNNTKTATWTDLTVKLTAMGLISTPNSCVHCVNRWTDIGDH